MKVAAAVCGGAAKKKGPNATGLSMAVSMPQVQPAASNKPISSSLYMETPLSGRRERMLWALRKFDIVSRELEKQLLCIA